MINALIKTCKTVKENARAKVSIAWIDTWKSKVKTLH